MDPPLSLRFGHSLNPVHSALVFHSGICTAAVEAERGFFNPAHFRFGNIDELVFEIMPLGIALIHPHQHGAEQCRLIPARARAYFHNNVSFIVFILRKQKNFKILLLLRRFMGKLRKLLFRKGSHLLLGFFRIEHRPAIRNAAFRFKVFIVSGNYRFKR